MTKRVLEEMIIGTVLLEERHFATISHILTAQNFGQWPIANHRAIWQCFEKHYPTRPIDLVTITSALRANHGLDYAYLLTTYTVRVYSARHLAYWAIMLLETDIREKAVAILTQYHIQAKDRNELIRASDIHTVIRNLQDMAIDLFETLGQAVEYLKGMGYENEYLTMQAYLDMVPKRINHIKKMRKLDTLLMNLFALSDLTAAHQAIIRDLMDMVRTVCNMGEIGKIDDIEKKIFELKNVMNQHVI